MCGALLGQRPASRLLCTGLMELSKSTSSPRVGVVAEQGPRASPRSSVPQAYGGCRSNCQPAYGPAIGFPARVGVAIRYSCADRACRRHPRSRERGLQIDESPQTRFCSLFPALAGVASLASGLPGIESDLSSCATRLHVRTPVAHCQPMAALPACGRLHAGDLQQNAPLRVA